jgi:hypothetical protein
MSRGSVTKIGPLVPMGGATTDSTHKRPDLWCLFHWHRHVVGVQGACAAGSGKAGYFVSLACLGCLENRMHIPWVQNVYFLQFVCQE